MGIQWLIDHYFQVGAIILFGVGLVTLLVHNNLIKKIIGLNIMDTAIYLFFISIGYINEKMAPIVSKEKMESIHYINPLPTALMLTGIVITVSVTAFALGLTIHFYEKYGTLELDEIIEKRGEEIQDGT